MLVPRPYQVETVNSIFDYFKAHPVGNPVAALPTGTGKAYVIALTLQKIFANWPSQKVLVLTHVKELIDQNYLEFLELWPTAPAGIYSAGLKRKDTLNPIIFAGIASVNKNVEAFGKVNLIFIDECHLLSQDEESMYARVIAKLKEVNPYLRVIGLTATPWRQGQGKITDDGIFTDFCINLTDMASFNRFIKEGYLCPLVARPTDTVLDISGVHLRGGEFIESELQVAVNKDEITWEAIKETITHGHDRKHWLVFGSGIAHVQKITEMLNYAGISTRCVHSKMPSKERDLNIKEWKEGKFTAMVNNGILTTGVNFKAIDLIVMLRPTHSTVLWIQMLGRGTRPYPEGYKINCMVLDFAGNTRRLGPINDPIIPRKRGEKTGEVPIKICDHCGSYQHISARFCGGEPVKTAEGCGMPFEFRVLLKETASTAELIRDDTPVIKVFKVDHTSFKLHQKHGRPDSIQVSYWCNNTINKFMQYICIEHEGGAQRKARQWWKERTSLPFPASTAEALKVIDTLLVPTHVKVWINTTYPEVRAVSFTGGFETAIIDDDVPF
jgi:DNA repair protein RadD